MGVTIRKDGGKWFVHVNHNGRRKAKCIGTSREAALAVRRAIEQRLAIGDLGIMDPENQVETFGSYARRWQKEYVEVHLKNSSGIKHEQVLRIHLLPVFENRPLNSISRAELKAFVAELVQKPKQPRKRSNKNGKGSPEQNAVETLSKNSVRLIRTTLQTILQHAVEDGLIPANPAVRLGRFAKVNQEKFVPSPLTAEEVELFLNAAKENDRRYYPLFLTALRAGLRRGELVALKLGDIHFGNSEDDPNRYLLVQHNYVYGEFTTTKAKKFRRVDLSKQLRAQLLRLYNERLVVAKANGKVSISDELAFPAPGGGVLDPDNLYDRYFLPVLRKAGLRRIRLHDMRHTFGALLIQNGASLAYVRDQMGHSSIQVTADIYGHLVPGANVGCVDRLDHCGPSD